MATTLNMTLLLRRAKFDDSCVLQLGEPGCFLDFNPDGSLNANSKNYTFKVGDGKTAWTDLPIANETQIQGMIDASINAHKAGYYTKDEIDDLLDALEQAIGKVASDLAAEVTARQEADEDLQEAIDTKLATETFNNWKTGHETDHAPSATKIASDIAGAVAGEAALREAADNAINAKIGTGFDDGDNTVAKKIAAAEAAAKAHAEAQASAAIAEAESKDEARATAAAQALAGAKSELDGKISSGDAATLASAKAYTDEQVAAEALARGNADTALDNKITALRNEIGNLTNVMNFRGAVTSFDAITDPVEGDVITFSAELKDGDAVVAKAGSEWVYSAGKWVEIGTASASDAAIADLKSRMGAAEGDIDQAQADILALGTNKLNTSDFNTWKQGFEADKKAHENDHAKKQTEITADIATAKSEAITEAGKLDTALHTEISKEIDDDVKAAIDAEVTRSDAKAKELADAAKSYADSQDTALQTNIVGGDTDTTYAKTIKGAKDFADAKATAAKEAAISAAAADATSKANAAQAAAEATAAADATSKANTAESNAKSYAKDYADTEIGKEKTRAEGQEAAIRSEFAAADTATLTSAKAYADEKVTDAHKNYQTATVKDAAHDSATNPSFITSISIDKGHVTGATVRNLAEVLEAMTFIFDGGTSAN